MTIKAPVRPTPALWLKREISNCYSILFPANNKRYSNDTFMKILPAMCDRRACIWCIHRNNSSKELEEWSWMFWYAMIGPSCILKLFYLSTIRVSHLFLLKKIQNNSKQWLKYVDICWAMYSQRHMSICCCSSCNQYEWKYTLIRNI